ncbi:T9SS type A sorting domain-containing protein [Bacteroidota bacterium]
MKYTIAVILFLISCLTYSQNFTPTEINTGGDNEITEDYSFTYSVGGLAVSTLSSDNVLTQGYQQPYNIFISDFTYLTNIKFKAKAFPNPTIDFLHLSMLSEIEPVLCYVRILNNFGKTVSAPVEYFEFSKGQNITLNMKELQQGTYLIQLISHEKNDCLVQFKVIKL